MPDLVLWLLLALAAVLSAMVLSAVLEVLFGREPAEPAPLVFEPIALPPACDELTQLLPVRFVGRARVVDGYATLAEFAGASHKTAATIWAELDGVFTAKGLRTA